MTTIVTRAGKGSPLTNTEMDSNLSNLNNDKIEASDIRTLTNKTINAANNTLIGIGTTVSVVAGTTQSAAVNTHYVLTSTATTVTLPASPAAGDQVWVTVANGLTTNVIARNGNEINGVAEDLTIDNAYATVMLRWIDSTRDWRLI